MKLIKIIIITGVKASAKCQILGFCSIYIASGNIWADERSTMNENCCIYFEIIKCGTHAARSGPSHRTVERAFGDGPQISWATDRSSSSAAHKKAAFARFS